MNMGEFGHIILYIFIGVFGLMGVLFLYGMILKRTAPKDESETK